MADPTPLEAPTRLSRSVIWDLQRRYFEHTGPAAWTKGEVPSYVTTNAFLAASYARVLLAFVEDAVATPEALPFGRVDLAEPLYILELGAGSGRLGFLVARELAELTAGREDLPPLRLVLTDFAEANVAAWEARAELAPLVAAGRVDFAVFDADEPGPIRLRQSGHVLEEGSLKNPLAVVANYVVDTLRMDNFAVQDGRLYEMAVQAAMPEGGRSADEPEASKDVLLQRSLRPAPPDYYGDRELDGLLSRYTESLSRSEFSVPIGAIRALRFLSRLCGDRMLLLTGDKAYRHLADLERRKVGTLARHGSFSMTANFDALGYLAGLRGGQALFHGNRYTEFTVAALATAGGEPVPLPRLRRAFADHIDRFGPAEFHRLIKMLREEAKEAKLAGPDGGHGTSLPKALVVLRLANYDATQFTRFAPVLLDIAEVKSRAVLHDLAICVEEAAKRAYPVGRSEDAVFQGGRILYRMDRVADAAVLFERATAQDPERKAAWFNLGLCMERLERKDEAQRAYRTALDLDPDYDNATQGLQRLG